MQTAKNMKSLGYVADMRGAIPESWACVDCGINTAPGCLNRARMEQALAADWNNKGITNTFCGRSEGLQSQAAGMESREHAGSGRLFVYRVS
jgi:hypothetical protein